MQFSEIDRLSSCASEERIAKVCNRFSKWGKKFPPSSLDYLLFFASASKTAFVNGLVVLSAKDAASYLSL